MFKSLTSVVAVKAYCIFISFALKNSEFTLNGICLGKIKKSSVEVASDCNCAAHSPEIILRISCFGLIAFSAARNDTMQAATIPVGLDSYVRSSAEQKLMLLFASFSERTSSQERGLHKNPGEDWKQEQALDCRERNKDKILFYTKLPMIDGGSIGATYFNVRKISRFKIFW